MARLLLTSNAFFVVLLLAAAAPASASWVWPLRGQVIAPYSNGDDPYASGQHRGIDIAGPVGAPVVAAAGGEVRFAGVAGSSGLTVSVRTADGYDTSYLHLSSALVREGERVPAGASLGAVGTTGIRSSAEAHLHFGVRDAGTRHAYHDPLGFLPAAPPAPGDAPRPQPVPHAVPGPQRVPLAPAPEPLSARQPQPAGQGVPERLRAPRGVPVPGSASDPAPARRRVHVPAGAPAPHPAEVPATAHVLHGRPALGALGEPRPDVAGLSARADGTPAAQGGTDPSVRTSRGLGKERTPLGSGAEVRAHAGHPASRRAIGAGRAPGGARTSSSVAGPDVGMVIACAGLLLAAGLLGVTSQGRNASARGGRRLMRLLQPVVGRG